MGVKGGWSQIGTLNIHIHSQMPLLIYNYRSGHCTCNDDSEETRAVVLKKIWPMCFRLLSNQIRIVRVGHRIIVVVTRKFN